MNCEKIERVSKALADKTRLRIFEAIRSRRRMSCGELVTLRGVTPATISHHLKILLDSGLIACHREGQFVFSTPVRKTLRDYTRALTALGRTTKK